MPLSSSLIVQTLSFSRASFFSTLNYVWLFSPCRVYRQTLAVPYAPATFVLHNLLCSFFLKRKIILLMSTGDCFSVKVENIPFLNESKGFCCSCWKKYWPVPFVPTNSFLFFFSVVLCWFQKVVTSCINLSVEFEVLESDQCDVVHLPKQDRPTS